jgi:hypothetical protein
MLKHLLLLMLLLCGGRAHAQSGGAVWCPPGATWTYSFNFGPEYGDAQVRYARDTVVNGRTCQVLTQQIVSRSLMYPTQGLITRSFPPLITAADADKVYVYANNQFFTLYDFAAQRGDH